MERVTLRYVSGSSTFSETFDCFQVNPYQVELEKLLHDEANGGIIEDNIGYRRRTIIDFAPLMRDLTKLYFLFGFAASNARTVIGDFGTREVVLMDKSLPFQFLDKFKLGDAFKLTLIDKDVSRISDDGSTKVLTLTYRPGGGSAAGTYYVDLEDEDTIELVKEPLSFIDGGRDDTTLGYRHKLIVEFGPTPTGKIDWLTEFCLWGKKQIDTTACDPVGGLVYDVVLLDKEIPWQITDGVKDVVGVTLNFTEKAARITTENPPEPPVTDDSGILIGDEGEGDTKVGA